LRRAARGKVSEEARAKSIPAGDDHVGEQRGDGQQGDRQAQNADAGEDQIAGLATGNVGADRGDLFRWQAHF
jgi:hypothetical protein